MQRQGYAKTFDFCGGKILEQRRCQNGRLNIASIICQNGALSYCMFGQIPNHKLLSNSIIGLENKSVAAVREALDGERFTELKLVKN